MHRDLRCQKIASGTGVSLLRLDNDHVKVII